ncbi:hypothetical protein UFOVP770_5 [uncultured Caudovirales phage]|uniref:Uncharacterized protein n=1 Tax=uncultured Caudovirales phage TaxID=2100421 RepID=A0A6J5NP84_9CAUD|nr:hypothetical protein UFOVP770_5 [uncultured Caudovirales phage]
MSHFAKVCDGKVVQVIVAEKEFFDTFVDSSPGEWIQTSYNTHGNQHPEGRPLRGNYAGIGYTYDSANDVFYAPQPFASWLLNETTWTWEAPTPYPNDNKLYKWNEDTTSWIEVKE